MFLSKCVNLFLQQIKRDTGQLSAQQHKLEHLLTVQKYRDGALNFIITFFFFFTYICDVIVCGLFCCVCKALRTL